MPNVVQGNVYGLNWPADLPQLPISPYQQAPKYAPADNTIRSSVDAGPAKQRRRFTAVPEPLSIQMILNEDELATLRSFKRDTCQDVLPFAWTNFTDGTDCMYRFMGAGITSVEHYADDMWVVTMDMEKLP